MYRIAIAALICSPAFGSIYTADMNFNLSSLPGQAIVTGATFSLTQSTSFSPGPTIDANSFSCGSPYPNYCANDPFTGNYGVLETWIVNDGPFLDEDQFQFDFQGLGFGGIEQIQPPGTQFASPVTINPQAIAPGGNYKVFINTGASTLGISCEFPTDPYCLTTAPNPPTFFAVSGQGAGTLDVDYTLGGVANTMDFQSTASWNYVTPEPDYRFFIFGIGASLLGLRAVLAQSKRKSQAA